MNFFPFTLLAPSEPLHSKFFQKTLILAILCRVSNVEFIVVFIVEFMNATMNTTMNSTNNDKGFKKIILFHLDCYFFWCVLLRFLPKCQKSLVFMAARPKKAQNCWSFWHWKFSKYFTFWVKNFQTWENHFSRWIRQF